MADFIRLLKFLWDNRSTLLTLLEALPPALGTAGTAIEAAGEAAVGASRLIRDSGSPGPNAEDLFSGSADMFDDIKAQFALLRQQVDAIRKNELFGVLGVLAGLKVPLDLVYGQLDVITKQLDDTADNLNDVSAVMRNTGGQLAAVGEGLSEAGGLFRQISDG